MPGTCGWGVPNRQVKVGQVGVNRQVLGKRYQIDRELRANDCLSTQLGFDPVLHRAVAIASLAPAVAADPVRRGVVTGAWQALADLNHRHVATIYSDSPDAEPPYAVMEYIPGDTLRQIIDNEGPFHPDDVSILVDQLASAAQYLAAHGLSLCGLTPGDIVVDASGMARVTSGWMTADGPWTIPPSTWGAEHAYPVAPEVAAGSTPTPRTDAYALAAIAYEMLAGQPLPSPVGEEIAVIPHPTIVNPLVPGPAGDAVMQALSIDPRSRPADAAQFAASLARWNEGLGLPAPQVASGVTAPPAGMIPPAPYSYLPEDIEESISAPRQRPRLVTWVISGAVLAGLLALVWFGSQLAGDDGTSTPTSAIGTTSGAVLVPDVVNQEVATAVAKVEAKGFIAEVVTDDARLDTGRVLDQDPKTGASGKAGDTVRLVVGGEERTVDLAALELTGMAADDAEELLKSNGLEAEREQVASTTIEPGKVVSTDPADSAVPGSTVLLQVSVGDKVQIDQALQGQPVQDVESALVTAGLEVAKTVTVDAATIESQGVDLTEAGIEPGDVVGIQSTGTVNAADVVWGGWVKPGTDVVLVVYEPGTPSP